MTFFNILSNKQIPQKNFCKILLYQAKNKAE